MTPLLMRSRRLSMALTLIVGTVATPIAGVAGLAAQRSSAVSHRTPVTVALVSALPLDGSKYAAVVVRTPGGTGRDVILLPRATATGLLLDEATRALLHMRGSSGDRPSVYHGRSFRSLKIGVRPPSPSAARDKRSVGLAQRVVDRLVGPTAPIQDLPGIGRVPALEFIPPAGRKSGRAPGA
jgi:hypothetical protein